MAPSCARGGLKWLLGKKVFTESVVMEEVAKGSGEIFTPGMVHKICG